VRGLDKGNYKGVKIFTFVGICIGWIGLIIPSFAFYRSFRELNAAVEKENKVDNKTFNLTRM